MELVTQRLILRALRPDDEAFFSAHHNHPDAHRHQDTQVAAERLPEVFRLYLKATASKAPQFCLAITTHTGEPIGLIFCTLWPSGPAEQVGSLGIVVIPDAQNQGFATEASAALLRFCFQERKATRMTMGCYASNPASRRVIQKLGLQPLPLPFRATLVLQGKIKPSELWHELTYRAWLQQRIVMLEQQAAPQNGQGR